jgi:threonylcarbamoyladenosine tRNA methylthiotransferase CDKAL1
MADTEIIRGLVGDGGYELVDDYRQADFSVLVTCSVKSVTEQRMLSRIRTLSSNSQKVVVAGCLPKADPSKVLKVRSDLSLVGPDNISDIIPALEATSEGRQLVSLERKKSVKLGLPRTRLNSVIGIVEISSGCLSACTFCQVKLVKGVVFSYPEKQIVQETESLVNQGAKEVWLTSTDNSAYGRDSKTNLPSLVRQISSIPGDFKIRLGMMNPLLTERLIDEFIKCLKLEKVFKFVHLPVQSGSDRVLREMRRGYSVNDFESMVARIRSEIPWVTLSTDMIVGFPTETDSEFEESMDLLRRVKPDVLNLSRFGARSGTEAAVMEGQISSEISKSRSVEMSALSKETQKEYNSRWIGWKGKIILDENVRGAVVGRNFAYKPCLINVSGDDASFFNLGSEVDVEVVSATCSTLRVRPA